MKKTLSILLISAMLLMLMPLAVFAAPTGTAITSASQLYNISTSDTGNYYLANDITISGYWEGKNFKGNLDGNGHTIYLEEGVTIKNGVFNGLWGSYVKNLNIIQKGSATYQARSSAIGVLTRGVNNNNVTISNVYIKADMSNINYDGMSPNVGAFVGQVLANNEGPKANTSLLMENCVFVGKIVKASTQLDRGTAAMVGGTSISGTYTASITIRNCINYGDISSGSPAGSMFGKPTIPDGHENTEGAGIQSITISGCINYGDIEVTGASTKDFTVEHAGGLFGVVYQQWNSTLKVTNNVNYGNVTSPVHGGGIGGGVRYHNDTTFTSNGNVNYGVVSAGTNVGTNVGSVWQRTDTYNGEGSMLYNYCNDKSIEKGSGASNCVVIDEDALANLASFGADKYTTLPNGKITLTWAKEAGYGDEAVGSADTSFVGAQLSGTGSDETRSVRFVGGLDAEFTNLDEVGIMIIASYGDGQTKTFEGQTATVYESILADGETILASDNGVDYFYTAAINDIPTNVGTITFTVFAFQLDGDAVMYSNSTTLTVDMTA